MTFPFRILNGQTEVGNMSADYVGGIIHVQFFNAGGVEVIPVGVPTFTRSGQATGTNFQTINQSSRGEWRFNGPAMRVRLSLAGVTGFSTYLVTVWRYYEPVAMEPDGVYSGLRAMTTQPYTEANVKAGTQFHLRAAWPSADQIVPATPRKLLFVTGAKPVIVKLRDFHYSAEELTISLFSGPTGVSGGTPVTIRNYNGVNPQASTVSVTKDVATVSDGAPIDDPEYFFGSQTAAQRAAGSIPLGRERILPANSSFLVVIAASAGTAGGRAQYFLDWYEGPSDLPLGL